MVSRDCTHKTWNHNTVIHTTKLETPYYPGVDIIQYVTIISVQLTAPQRSILDISSRKGPPYSYSKLVQPPSCVNTLRTHSHTHTHKHIRLLDPPNREHSFTQVH